MSNRSPFSTLTTIIIMFLLLATTVSAQTLQAPENVEEIKEMGEKAMETGKRDLPEIIKDIWNNEAMPVWKKMYEWFKINIWEPVFKGKIEPRIREEVKKREPIVQEELLVEEEEVKQELPGLWERFKQLWRIKSSSD